MNIIVESTLHEPIEQTIASKGIVTTEVVNTFDMIRDNYVSNHGMYKIQYYWLVYRGFIAPCRGHPHNIYNVNIMYISAIKLTLGQGHFSVVILCRN